MSTRRKIVFLIAIIIIVISFITGCIRLFMSSDKVQNHIKHQAKLKREHPVSEQIHKADAIYKLRNGHQVTEFTPKTGPHQTCIIIHATGAIDCFDKENH